MVRKIWKNATFFCRAGNYFFYTISLDPQTVETFSSFGKQSCWLSPSAWYQHPAFSFDIGSHWSFVSHKSIHRVAWFLTTLFTLSQFYGSPVCAIVCEGGKVFPMVLHSLSPSTITFPRKFHSSTCAVVKMVTYPPICHHN